MPLAKTLALVPIGAALALASPAGAVPTTYFASPDGMGNCLGAPCQLPTALGVADGDDEVLLAPGTYGSPDTPITLSLDTLAALVHGDEDQAAPTVYAEVPLRLNSPASTARHLSVMGVNLGPGGNALESNGRVERVRVNSAGETEACHVVGGTISDSACTGGYTGLLVESGAVVRNVTARGATGLGLTVLGGTPITVSNSILEGSLGDVYTQLGASTVNLDHSNYATTAGNGTVTPPGSGTNQMESPLLADFPDFHELAGSPSIDKGGAGPLGDLDIDGDPRVVGTAPDIGADEYVPPAPPGGGSDAVDPVLGSLGFAPAAFRAAKGGGSVVAAAPVGTRVSYSLSEAATVTFRVERQAPGRKVKRRCRKPTKKNRKAKRCKRYVKVKGSFSHAGTLGDNSLRFSGRVSGRKLRPGRYRLIATATDNAGNVGAPKRKSFRIVRR